VPEPAWAATAAWTVGNFLRGQDVQQGARLGLGHRWARLRVDAHYEILPGQDVNTQDATMTVSRHPFDLEVGYGSPVFRRWCLVAAAFVSGDLVARHTSFAAPPLSAQPDDRRWVVGAGLRGRVELRLLRNLAVHLGLGTEAPLNPHDFQLLRGTTSATVARLAPVRVSGEAGLDVLGF
jgi:hypothetical protein